MNENKFIIKEDLKVIILRKCYYKILFRIIYYWLVKKQVFGSEGKPCGKGCQTFAFLRGVFFVSIKGECLFILRVAHNGPGLGTGVA
jgi:hypothetical protein